jgi:hypothetical protein
VSLAEMDKEKWLIFVFKGFVSFGQSGVILRVFWLVVVCGDVLQGMCVYFDRSKSYLIWLLGV